jgi:hypothetical protein
MNFNDDLAGRKFADVHLFEPGEGPAALVVNAQRPKRFHA